MTKRERPGWPLPFSESGFHHYSKNATTGVGNLWRNAEDDLLVGLLGQSYGTYPPEDWILSGARAELQRREIESTETLADLQRQQIEATGALANAQRSLLDSIEKFNVEAGQQTEKVIALTDQIRWLTVALFVIAILQLVAAGVQIYAAFYPR